MQSQREAGIGSGMVQTPLLTQSQLRVGVWLTGVAAVHVWEVREVDNVNLILKKLPGGAGECDSHTWTTVGGGRVCACGARQQPIKDFLPLKPEKARVYLMEVPRAITVPAIGELYAGLVKGAPVIISVAGGRWSQAIPIIPELHKVWELPAGLGAMLGEAALGGELVEG